MNSWSRQPDKSENENAAKPQESLKEAAERRRRRQLRQLLSMGITQLSAAPSRGERLLPIILAVMEACWADAILIGLAGIGLFQSRAPIVPLWTPFILIAGSHWLSSYLERRDVGRASEQNDTTGTVTPGTSLVIALIGVVTLLIIWLRVYAQTAFVIDPRWLLSLLNDLLLFNANAYLVVTILGLCVYFCWRGIRLARREIEPAHVLNVLRLGLVITVAVVVVRAGEESAGMVFHDELTLFLLVPLFLILSLAAHTLARAASIRHSHPVGLAGSVVTQERALMLIIGAFGLVILLVTLSVGNLAVPTFLTNIQGPLGAVYDWLIDLIAHVIVFLVTPLFWLIAWFEAKYPPRLSPVHRPNVGGGRLGHHKPAAASDPVLVILIPILKMVLPILFVLLLLLLIRRVLRRRRVRITAQRREEEVHESLWSWSLFWTQFNAFLRALFARFFPRRAAEVAGQAAAEVIEGGPTARSVREIYRMLLKRAASRGYARKKDETPYEFRQRLDDKTPLAEPHLEIITEAYTATRYGGLEPDEAEVAQVRRAWAEVEQKWSRR